MELTRIYGKVKLQGHVPGATSGHLQLLAPKDAPDGIGCALAMVPWDGRRLTIETKILDRWRPEAWADFWLVFPLEAGEAYPLGYVRSTAGSAEWGIVRGGEPEDQEILGTVRVDISYPPKSSDHDKRAGRLVVSADENTIHVGYGDRTLSLRWKNTGRLGLYCEGCVVQVRIR